MLYVHKLKGIAQSTRPGARPRLGLAGPCQGCAKRREAMLRQVTRLKTAVKRVLA